MLKRAQGTAGLIAAMLAACSPADVVPSAAAEMAPPAKARGADLAGVYRSTGPRPGELTVGRAGTEWRVSLRGGSDPAAGAGAAADCELVAQGPLVGGRIVAPVIPFEGETVSVTAEDLAARPATVTAQVTGRGLQVSTDYAGCGLGADLSGLYSRSTAARQPNDTRMTAERPSHASPTTALRTGDDLTAVRRAFPDARLRIVEAYPWAMFAVLGPDGREAVRLRFDGENAELADGSNTFARIGEVVSYDALKPTLRVAAVEPPGTPPPAGESGAPPAAAD